MAVRVRITSIPLMFLLLCSALLATTLQDVQGEVEVEGPSESECRPYIEKALKKLETGDTQSADVQDDITHIVTTDDSDTQSGEAIESIEAKSVEEETQEVEDEQDANEKDTGETESVEVETTKDESDADETGDTQEVSAEEKADTEDESEQTDTASGEKEGDTEEAAESAENEASVESEQYASAEKEETEEKEDGTEEQKSTEEDEEAGEASTEEGATSAEQENSTASVEEEGEASVEEEVPSTEEAAGSAEEEAGSTEGAVSVEEGAVSAEEDVASAEESAASVEGGVASAEAGVVSAEDDVASAEIGAVSAEEGGASAEQEEVGASVEQEEAVVSAEEEAESGASAEQEERGVSAEQEVNASAQQEEGGHEQEAASTEQENGAATEEDETDANTEKAVGSTEQEESASAEDEAVASAEQEGAASTEKDEASVEQGDVVSEEEKESSSEKDKASLEQRGSAEQADETASVEKEASTETEDENKDSGEKEEGKGDKEESGEKSGEDKTKDEVSTDGDADSKQESTENEQADEESASKEGEEEGSKEGETESIPEEDLTWEVEIPSELRSRDHLNDILDLSNEPSESNNLILKAAGKTLNELKKIYENAIKPLETLYKYRDLSNRHFGDPEIFSKPLVLFMGPWSGGKSSIINYLLDNEYTHTSLRTGAEPSPAYFNLLMWGEEPEVLDGTQLAADWTFSGLQKFGQGLEERLRGLKLPNKLLEKINIVEIPGILEVRKQVSRMFPFNDACQWFIDRADIIFLVYDPSKLDVGPETEAILDQLKGREYQTRIILNKADQVKPEELMRVQGALIWNISPLMSSAQPPVMYTTSLWSKPYEVGAPVRLFQAQERAFLKDLKTAVDKRIENKISSARRFAVRVRNHAKMVDCYLTTYYNHKSVFGNKKLVSDQIIEHPQDYHIYEGLSTLTNISRYDLPDPDVYRDFFRLNPLYDFQQLSATCTYFRGCPINRLDVAIAYDLPELVGKYKKMIEPATNNNADSSTKS